jgi:glycosyltransferase involved in cell wall biosynthesis
MKVLLINKFYHLNGGAERHLFDWENLLRAHGHDVFLFSMKDPRNRPCAQEPYFIDPVRFDGPMAPAQMLRAAAHSIWSRQAARRIEALLSAEGTPDIAHVHSFVYQLTPSILGPLARRGVPIVQTCHEYAHICVNQHLYNQRTEQPCRECLRRGRLAPLLTRCMKGSLAASAAGVAAGLADSLLARSRARIRRFLAVSEFMRRELLRGGLPPRRVFCTPNFIDADSAPQGEGPGRYVLFLGRLTPYKGIRTFLRAARLAAEVPCKVAGAGPLEAEARRDAPANVEVLGHREGQALSDLVRHARVLVAPSEWYEPFGLVILEAMAAGRAVIASRMAGPAEIISDGRDGLLTPPADPEALSAAMRRLWAAPDLAAELGRNGRDKVRLEYGAEAHYARMMTHFEQVLRSKEDAP